MGEAFKKNEFLKNLSVLVGGTALSQLINIVALPILTRLYSPEEFGVLASYLGLVTIFVTVASLRLEVAIPLPSCNNVAINLAVLSMSCVVIISSLVGLVSLYLINARVWLPENLMLLVYFIPLSIFLHGLLNILQFWTSREKKYVLLARSKVVSNTFGVAGKVSVGVYNFGVQGLVFGQLLQHFVGIAMLALNFLYEVKARLNSITLKSLKRAFIEYHRFPKYSMWEAFASIAGMQVPILMIASYAEADAGYLALAIQLLSVPMALVGASAAQVFIVQASDKRVDGGLYLFTVKTAVMLAKIGLFPLLLAALILPYVIPIIFGKEWAQVGAITSWLVPCYLLQFIVSPVSMSLHIIGKQIKALLLQILGLVLRVGGVAVAIFVAEGSVIPVYAISSAVFYFVFLIVVLYEVKGN